MFSGYTPLEDLPVKSGARVRVKAGSEIRSMHPKKSVYRLKRTQEVQVHHLMNGWSQPVGVVYRKPGQEDVDNFHWTGATEHDLREAARKHGLPCQTQAEFDAAMTRLRDIALQHLRQFAENSTVWTAYVPMANPAIVWAGTGGYWCETDIANLETSSEGPKGE